MTVGQRIVKYRKMRGLTQVQLADRVGIMKQLLWKYETGDVTNIPLDKFERIAQELNVNPAVLAGWVPEEDDELS